VCLAPSETSGYLITEHNLEQDDFKVDVKCAAEYIGNPTAATCSEQDNTYKLQGCEKKVYCFANKALGYQVTETNLVMQAFDVQAECAATFHGAAKVAACTSAGHYELSGCAENFCVAPDTTGYAVSEVELREHKFQVTASCDTGYEGKAVVKPCTLHNGKYTIEGCTRKEVFCVAPSVTSGYTVTETDLRVDEFEVKASCAPGWSGTARVSKCTGSTQKVSAAYSLSGCSRR